MRTFNISKDDFASLDKLKLLGDIYNNESELYLINSSNGHQFLIKKFIDTTGKQFYSWWKKQAKLKLLNMIMNKISINVVDKTYNIMLKYYCFKKESDLYPPDCE